MPQPQLFDHLGKRVLIGRQIGRRGGEGSAYEATSHPGKVVKLYHQPPPAGKVSKLHHLCRLAEENPKLLTFAAWPTSVVSGAGKARGFLMPFVKGKEIHQLFSPKERFAEFPAAGWDFLVHVARNCAAAFDSVHELGAVIGDVNEGNLLVTPEGLVRLIDCDSYQIQGPSELWTCDVGVPLWTAPELQGKNFRGLKRTVNHDVFGLAVLIFKTLFMGRHPYAGIPIRQDAEFVLEKAIGDYRFAFSAKSVALGLRTPPHSLPMTALPLAMQDLFERAFLKGSEKGARPAARDWAKAIDELSRNLGRCKDPAHKYPKSLLECPWCTIAGGGGPVFFVAMVAGGPAGVDPTAVWLAISRIEKLRFEVPVFEKVQIPKMVGRPPTWFGGRFRTLFVVGVLLFAVGAICCGFDVLLGLGAIFLGGGLMSGGVKSQDDEMLRRRAARDKAEQNQRKYLRDLATIETQYQSQFTASRTALRTLADRFVHLDRERKVELQKLERTKSELQKREYLDHQLIGHAKLPGFGPGRVASLQGYGIESALDVTPKMNVAGLGDVYTSRLLAWRRRCESAFRFDPMQPVPAAEIRQLDQRMKTVRDDLLAELQQGPVVLTRLNTEARTQFRQTETRAQDNLRLLAQATADLARLEQPSGPALSRVGWAAYALSAIFLTVWLIRGPKRDPVHPKVASRAMVTPPLLPKRESRVASPALPRTAPSTPRPEAVSTPVPATPRPLPTGPAEVEARLRAISRYPQLKVAGSPLHRAFLARVQRYQVENPEIFDFADWPTVIALECATELAQPPGMNP